MARILLVDDDVLLHETVARILVLQGHEVLRAHDGKQAISQLRRQPVDLVLTDILMPEADGLEVVRIVRREHPAVAIIVMSGGSSRLGGAEALQLAHSLGADALLAKPFGAADLREVIAGVLPG